MTVEEAKSKAEYGDVNAMVALGDYYMNQEPESVDDAEKWYEMAANHGEPLATKMTVLLKRVQASVGEAMENVIGTGDVKNRWQETYIWCLRYISVLQNVNGLPDFFNHAEAEKWRSEAAYKLSLYKYATDDYKDNEIPELLAGINDDRAAVLLGVVLFEKAATNSEYTVSYRHLSRIVDNDEYLASQKSKWEELVFCQSTMFLSICYREGNFVGIEANLENAMNILKFAKKHIKDKDYIAMLDKQLSHYKPKLFGGYKYIE